MLLLTPLKEEVLKSRSLRAITPMTPRLIEFPVQGDAAA